MSKVAGTSGGQKAGAGGGAQGPASNLSSGSKGSVGGMSVSKAGGGGGALGGLAGLGAGKTHQALPGASVAKVAGAGGGGYGMGGDQKAADRVSTGSAANLGLRNTAPGFAEQALTPGTATYMAAQDMYNSILADYNDQGVGGFAAGMLGLGEMNPGTYDDFVDAYSRGSYQTGQTDANWGFDPIAAFAPFGLGTAWSVGTRMMGGSPTAFSVGPDVLGGLGGIGSTLGSFTDGGGGTQRSPARGMEGAALGDGRFQQPAGNRTGLGPLMQAIQDYAGGMGEDPADDNDEWYTIRGYAKGGKVSQPRRSKRPKRRSAPGEGRSKGEGRTQSSPLDDLIEAVPSRQVAMNVPSAPMAPVTAYQGALSTLPAAAPVQAVPRSVAVPVAPAPAPIVAERVGPMPSAYAAPSATVAPVDRSRYVPVPPGGMPAHLIQNPGRPRREPPPMRAAPVPARPPPGPVEPPPLFAPAAAGAPEPPPPPRGLTPSWDEVVDRLNTIARFGDYIPPDPMEMIFGSPRRGFATGGSVKPWYETGNWKPDLWYRQDLGGLPPQYQPTNVITWGAGERIGPGIWNETSTPGYPDGPPAVTPTPTPNTPPPAQNPLDNLFNGPAAARAAYAQYSTASMQPLLSSRWVQNPGVTARYVGDVGRRNAAQLTDDEVMAWYDDYRASGAGQPASAYDQLRQLLGFKDGGVVVGPGGGRDDMAVARHDTGEPIALSDGEFVWPADVVSALGDGSTRAGAQKLAKTAKQIRSKYRGALGGLPAPSA